MARGAKVYLELEEISKTGFAIVLYYKGGLISDFRKLFTITKKKCVKLLS